MTLKDRIKALCKANGISMNQLETDLHFGKGYISKLDKSTPNTIKIQKIADYFEVSVDYLMTGESPVEDEYYTNPETARMAQEMFEDPDMRSLFDMKRNMEPDKFKAHVNFMRELYRKEHPEDDGL